MKQWFSFLSALLFVCSVTINEINSQTSGLPDSVFGSLGEVQIEELFHEYYGGNSVLLPNGKLIVAGTAFDLASLKPTIVFTRLLPDGQIDLSYGISGQIRPNINISLDKGGVVSTYKLCNDGKILLAGTFVGENARPAFVAKVDEYGNLDESFAQGGVAIFNIGSYINKFETLVVKPDGKILLGGFSSMNNLLSSSLLLVQLNPDGYPDTEFGISGILVYNTSIYFKTIYSIAIQDDGKIITFGRTGDDADMQILRFFPNGYIDNSFASNGNFIFGLPNRDDVVYSGVIQENQKILFCGISAQRDTTLGEATLFRLNSDGTFDDDFGINGKVFFNLGLSESACDLILQPDEKIIMSVVGSISSYPSRIWTLRCNPNGSIDDEFGLDGAIQSPEYNHPVERVHLSLNTDNKIVLTSSVEGKLVIWRYLNESLSSIENIDKINKKIFNCRPNPVHDHLIFEWSQQESNLITCDLYNTQGDLIKTFIKSAFLEPGSYKELFFFEHEIPKGIYFLVFRSGNANQIIRIVIA